MAIDVLGVKLGWKVDNSLFYQAMTTVLFWVLVLVVVLICIIWGKRNRKAFEKRFPPISDEEFMARCKPGTNPEVALKVRRMISNSLGVDYERIYPSSRFVNDLDAY